MADSKVAISIFCHVVRQLRREGAGRNIGFVFDADEHSVVLAERGVFSATHPNPSTSGGVLIGYPGFDKIVCGSRGFLRCRIYFSGEAAHSGSSTRLGVNAIERAADGIGRLKALAQRLPIPSLHFPLPPKLTVTNIEGEAISRWCPTVASFPWISA